MPVFSLFQKRIRSLNLEEEGEGGAATHLASLAESPGDESSLLEADAAPGPDPEGAELGQAGSGALLDPPLLSHTSNCIGESGGCRWRSAGFHLCTDAESLRWPAWLGPDLAWIQVPGQSPQPRDGEKQGLE